jgi:hypothetical protein
VNGSFHKFFNKGIHNYNDFKLSDLVDVVMSLYRLFHINPKITELNNLEFGVNIKIPFAPILFLNSVISYGGSHFSPFSINDQPGNKAIGIRCVKSQFIIKIYDKSNQYHLPGPNHLLRFELKIIKMEFFNGRIKTLFDLLSPENLVYCGALLQSYFDSLLTCDMSSIPQHLGLKDRLIFSNGTNYKYWKELKPDSTTFTNGNKSPDYIRQRKKYYKDLERFKKLVKKYSCDKMQKDLSWKIRTY